MNNNLIIINKGKYNLEQPEQYYKFKFKPDISVMGYESNK